MANNTSNDIKVIFLDVNETLLDLTSMRSSVGKALGNNPQLTELWFSKMLHYSLVSNEINQYEKFSDIGIATLLMVAKSKEIPLTQQEAKTAIVTPLRSLPAHDDVIKGLQILKNKGYRIITLTNSSYEGVKLQMNNAQLSPYIDEMYSVDSVQKFKPSLKSYQWAIKQAGIKPQEAILIAAHGWDIAGAQKAGLKTAFIAREGKELFPLSPKPNYNEKTLIDIANKL
ncbi:haloacid dehalogenase type II [Halosquirtibacter xylanolyticus]|uniref:haloacid dehalogenase type II n=1 Tax=Halosquirtibacter xylanolyticus TaxID=3374599 RepID=UPI0037479659|nr:haloacid dehalogenase type II [Prolixibacteraceae bacterium]